MSADPFDWEHFGGGACAACDAPAREGDLMCRACWSDVTAATKAAVYRAVRRFRGGFGTLGDLRDVQRDAVAEALGRQT